MIKKMKTAAALVMLVAGCTTPPEATDSSRGSTVAGHNIVPGSQEDLVANVGDRVFFDFDKSTLSGNGALTKNNTATLDRQAAWLLKYTPRAVQIAGNCDERGTEEYNLALGSRRAHVTRDYLASKGVAPSGISTISYGKERPTAPGSTEDAWAQNRNATTSLR